MNVFIFILMSIIIYPINTFCLSFLYKKCKKRLTDDYIKITGINVIVYICMLLSVFYLSNIFNIIDIPSLKNIIISFLFIDMLHYFSHYISHLIPCINKHVHSTHHTHRDVMPLDLFYDNILDVVVHTGIMLYAPLLFVENAIEYIIILMVRMTHFTYIHSHIENDFPLPLFINAKFHSAHHVIGNGNYSFIFPIWDDFMGTRIKELPEMEEPMTLNIIKNELIETFTMKSMTMDEFKEECNKEKKLTIINNEIIDCTEWIHEHPGGDSVIKSIIGIDSTDIFNNVHKSSIVAKKMLGKYKIGYLVNIVT
jgi:sterol desaturase/sphingolipid hydroxylase (fatty acid hydroxylase superfamily)